MLKRIFLLSISFVSYLLLCFFLSFAFLSFKMNTNNAALLISILCAICFATGLTILHNVIMARRDYKKAKDQQSKNELDALMLLSDKQFVKSYADFIGLEHYRRYEGYILAKEDAYFFVRQHSALTLDQGIAMVRQKQELKTKRTACLLLCQTTPETDKLLKSNGFEIVPEQEILGLAAMACPDAGETSLNAPKTFKEKAVEIMLEPRMCRYCLKYALLLALVSIFSFYRIYYIVVAVILLLLSVLSKIMRQNQSKTIF